MSSTNSLSFTPGDLVLSVYGNGADDGSYGDKQASPIVLEEVTATGSIVGSMELPEQTTIVNGVTEWAISGEYGSASEGTLELSSDGKSLVIMGYGINDVTFNDGGASVYGTTKLAQTTSLLDGQYAAVPRVVATISMDGTVDTSTAAYNVFNTDNPRSVATVNGQTFYISGQGAKGGDTTQGVFVVQYGTTTTTPTPIYTATDTRTAEIYNGVLYISQDSLQPSGTGTENISNFGTTLPTGTTTPQILPGISQSVTLNGSNGNGINGSIGNVDLSPENFFFADPTTLYVADSGNPKEGTLGDGGLQKWTLNNGTWTLDYTLSNGLNLVANTASAGTTGLIGLTCTVVNGTAYLYATNATIGGKDPTFLFGITDSLSATSLPNEESFTTLVTAADDTNIRGVAFAPQCFAAGTMIQTAHGEVSVEALSEGDLVRTVDGGLQPVRWVGHRDLDCLRHPAPESVLPVLVAPHALGQKMPHRPLLLSPDHAVYAEGVLIPVKHLIDGDMVRQIMVERITYYHVELPEHMIILANGLPTESYLETGDRASFANGGEAMALHPLWGSEARDVSLLFAALGAAPLRVTGPEVARVRARLSQRQDVDAAASGVLSGC